MYVVAVVGVERNESFVKNLTLRRLCYDKSVAVARECTGRVAGRKLASCGNDKFKYSVRHENYRLGKALVKLHLNIGGVCKLQANLVTRLVLTIIALVYLVAKGAELDVAVCSYQL